MDQRIAIDLNGRNIYVGEVHPPRLITHAHDFWVGYYSDKGFVVDLNVTEPGRTVLTNGKHTVVVATERA